jgi:transposase-like protein
MGWAYSVDLRERVVAAFDRTGMTEKEVAALFKIGEATVRRWKRLKRETGVLERKPGGGGTRRESLRGSTGSFAPSRGDARSDRSGDRLGVPPAHWQERQPVVDEPSPSEAEPYAKKEPDRGGTGRPAHPGTPTQIHRARNEARPAAPRFIDEAGSHIAMTRDYARAPRGERAVGSVPRNAGTVTTMIGALDVDP